MSTCSRCGNIVEFRYVDGRCIPLHLNGGCIDDRFSSVNDYTCQNEFKNGLCFCTTCPKCRKKVFFIRHNGGSVWIEPPLGPPWNKHGCFDEDYKSTGVKSTLQQYYSIPDISNNSILGVATFADVLNSKKTTIIMLTTGKNQITPLLVKFSAGFLLGKLCIFDRNTSTIYPVEEPMYIYGIVSEILGKHNHRAKGAYCICSECNMKIQVREIKTHFSKKHNYVWKTQ